MQATVYTGFSTEGIAYFANKVNQYIFDKYPKFVN